MAKKPCSVDVLEIQKADKSSTPHSLYFVWPWTSLQSPHGDVIVEPLPQCFCSLLGWLESEKPTTSLGLSCLDSVLGQGVTCLPYITFSKTLYCSMLCKMCILSTNTVDCCFNGPNELCIWYLLPYLLPSHIMLDLAMCMLWLMRHQQRSS